MLDEGGCRKTDTRNLRDVKKKVYQRDSDLG